MEGTQSKVSEAARKITKSADFALVFVESDQAVGDDLLDAGVFEKDVVQGRVANQRLRVFGVARVETTQGARAALGGGSPGEQGEEATE